MMVSGEPSVPPRRMVVGAVSGIAPGIVLASILDPPGLGLALGPLFGIGYGLAFHPTEGTTLDHGLVAAALAIPAWALVQVTVLPLLRDGEPVWNHVGMLALLPALTAWLLAGVLLGILIPVVSAAVTARFGPAPRDVPRPDVETRIVILGGGFAGMTVARRLEELFGPDPTVEFVLVSETNAILFTPMLPEVAAGSLEPTHITSPLRTSLRRTQVIRAEATDVDLKRKRVVLGEAGDQPPVDADGLIGNGSNPETVPYDHLVLAIGSVPDYKGLKDVREVAFGFKTLQDAIRLRNHVIACFERADREDDAQQRQALVRFVIAGAGFAGAELAGALNDFVHEMLVYYPNIPPDEVEVVTVHSGAHILPELSESLGAYALERMQERGVTFRLETRVAGAAPGAVELSTGETLRTETLVWTAGVRPHDLIETIDVPVEPPGAVRADEHLAVPGCSGVWTAGDCAAVVDAATGDRHPPTAQHAIHAATVLAENLHATVDGGDLTAIAYEPRGSLAVIGHQVACAEIGDHQFSGLFAWFLWRTIYLGKLPGTERKIRVFVDWLIEIFFPRDIVQTTFETTEEHRER